MNKKTEQELNEYTTRVGHEPYDNFGGTLLTVLVGMYLVPMPFFILAEITSVSFTGKRMDVDELAMTAILGSVYFFIVAYHSTIYHWELQSAQPFLLLVAAGLYSAISWYSLEVAMWVNAPIALLFAFMPSIVYAINKRTISSGRDYPGRPHR